MIAALSAFDVAGVPTTIPVHLAILQSVAFRTGRYDTRSIPGWPPAS
jgi:biotin carboxylase